MRKFNSEKLAKLLWAALLVFLPVTSFKFIPFLGSGTFVRPLAIYPLAVLLPVLIFRILKKEIQRPFPTSLLLMVLFVLAIFTSCVIGGIKPPVALGGIGYSDRVIRSLVTLFIGLAFFISATWMNQSIEDVKFSVRWLMVGLGFTLLWGGIQFIGLNQGLRPILNRIQNLFSIRGLVKNKRVSGFAYEPSWLAGQLASLYLPWLFASLISNIQGWKNFFPKTDNLISRFSKLVDPINTLLIVSSFILLLFTYSRSGLAIILVAVVVTSAIAGGERIKTLIHWFISGFQKQTDHKVSFGQLGVRILLILIVIAVMVGTTSFLADKGYIAVFAETHSDNITDYIQNAYLGPRAAYLISALTSFEKHPIFGVGFGASGFSIYQNMPDWSLAGNPEIARQLSPDTNIFPNPKNMLIRLLAETGIVGFSIYLVFLLNLCYISIQLIKIRHNKRSIEYNWIGAAGLFGILSILLLGISQDSLAMPEIWIIPGILTGITIKKG